MSAARDRVRRLRRAIGRLSPLVSVRRRTLVALILASAGAGLVEALVLSLIAYIAATMSVGGDGHPFVFGPLELDVPISFLLGMAALLAAVRLLLQVVLARLPARLSGSVQSRLRAQLAGSFLASTWAERSKEREGHLQELMGGQSAQAGGAVLMLAAGVAAALEFTMLVVSALVLSVGVSMIVILTALTLFSALRPLSKRVRRRSAQTSAASIDQAAGVAEAVHLSEELEVFGVSEAERLKLLALTESLERHFVRTRTLSRIVPVLYQSAVILLLVAGLSVLHVVGTTRLAALGAVVLLLVRASAYGQQLQAAYQGVGEALPYVDRVTAAIQRYQANPRRAGENAIEYIQRVECANISFEYRRGSAVLRDVNCSIEKGEAVGVVGPSGAGKSTLLQLMLALRHPTRGALLVNGSPANELDEDVWRRKVSFLPQEPHLLWGTVADNIRFQRPWVDEAAIVEAARLSHIHDEIMSWQDAYQTVVGQTADAVSGGQRQRLCLARALAGRPEMVLLDEPTSSLDPRSEELIRASLTELKGRVTLIVVAHRLTTLSLCDRVMVIRGGVLEAFAPTDLLYASNDFYRQSVDLAAAGGA